jgi:hypothetical protein
MHTTGQTIAAAKMHPNVQNEKRAVHTRFYLKGSLSVHFFFAALNLE